MPGRWHERSSDPNSSVAVEGRTHAIIDAAAPDLIGDRNAYLCAAVEGKSILDVGVVEHTSAASESPDWLHGRLKRAARECLGVDVLAKEVQDLVGRGYDVLCLDVSREALGRQFEVIVAGEVLEHLDSPGSFMKNCAAMLAPGGKLIVTTPNPWYANAMIKSAFAPAFVDSVDHVAWYDAAVLSELAERNGLQLSRYAGIGSSRPRTWKGRFFFWLRPMLTWAGLNPRVFAKSVMYEFAKGA